MRQRCLNPSAKSFPGYGGRGIKICDRWLESFENFLADMGPRPSAKHSLDRQDNDGDYTPDNCRWATAREQILNRRNSRLVEYKGETRPLTEWCKLTGVSYSAAIQRLDNGWPVEDVFGVPVRDTANITHCKQGHAFTPENTITTNRQRRCRTCVREQQRKYKKRKREQAQ